MQAASHASNEILHVIVLCPPKRAFGPAINVLASLDGSHPLCRFWHLIGKPNTHFVVTKHEYFPHAAVSTVSSGYFIFPEWSRLMRHRVRCSSVWRHFPASWLATNHSALWDTNVGRRRSGRASKFNRHSSKVFTLSSALKLFATSTGCWIIMSSRTN